MTEALKFRDEELDEEFIDYFRDIPKGKKITQHSILDFIPKAFGEKRTYSQNWQAYDLAKTNETVLFKQLLTELLFLSDIEDKTVKVGRKGYSTKDKVFCGAIKVYTGSSLRKTQSTLKELKNLRLIEKVPCYKTITNFLADKKLADVLDRLISLTTLPLIHMEEVAAVDSSGFSLSKYEQWNEYKWGKKTGKERLWRKAHIVCGCKTNIILSVKMSDKNTGDSPVFPILAKEAKAHYDIKEITADKAYSSRKNLDFAMELGMVPYIPFKSNTSGRPKGKSWVWREMYNYFKNNEEDFNRHYHKRSNVETTFHMLKQRFGSNLTTKTRTANGVELKLKVLCHNICVLIQEYFEGNSEIDLEIVLKH